jgi:hypothetical protein
MRVAKVSSLFGVWRRSIRRIDAEEAVPAEVDDARERTRRSIGRCRHCPTRVKRDHHSAKGYPTHGTRPARATMASRQP